MHLHYLTAPSKYLNSRHLPFLAPISGTLCRADARLASPISIAHIVQITWRFSGRVCLPPKVWREISISLFCSWACLQHAGQSCWVLARPFINFSWRRFHVLDWQYFWRFHWTSGNSLRGTDSLGLWWNWLLNPLDNSFLVFQGKEFHSWWVHFEWTCAVMEKTYI